VHRVIRRRVTAALELATAAKAGIVRARRRGLVLAPEAERAFAVRRLSRRRLTAPLAAAAALAENSRLKRKKALALEEAVTFAGRRLSGRRLIAPLEFERAVKAVRA
jgi:hypothetical protein